MMTPYISLAIRIFTLLLLATGLLTRPAQAQLAPATVPVSDSLARYFLARAMTMQGLDRLSGTERREFASWAGKAGTRFAGRVGGFWYTPENPKQEQALFDTTRQGVAALRAASPAIVVQGSVFEIVYPHVTNLPVPNAVRIMFGEDTLAVPTRHFRFQDMMYPAYYGPTNTERFRWYDLPPGEAPGVPDMSRPETQLWFFSCAKRLLDAGCEAIHFGQVTLMNRRDLGHQGWHTMLQKVRHYAATRNRGFVLCDAHTHGEYYDPDPRHPLPDSARQLLFDFNSFPLRATETDTIRSGQHGVRLDVTARYAEGQAIFQHSKGGIAPRGYPVQHQPALVELDNWGITNQPGKPGQWPYLWGFDEISWFATQSAEFRNQWLVYAHARVRQLDLNTYLQLPGIRGVTAAPPQPDWLYRADVMGQQDIIPAIWAGKTVTQAEQLLLVGPHAK